MLISRNEQKAHVFEWDGLVVLVPRPGRTHLGMRWRPRSTETGNEFRDRNLLVSPAKFIAGSVESGSFVSICDTVPQIETDCEQSSAPRRTQAHKKPVFGLWCGKRLEARCHGTALKLDKAASFRRTPKPSASFSGQKRPDATAGDGLLTIILFVGGGDA